MKIAAAVGLPRRRQACGFHKKTKSAAHGDLRQTNLSHSRSGKRTKILEEKGCVKQQVPPAPFRAQGDPSWPHTACGQPKKEAAQDKKASKMAKAFCTTGTAWSSSR